MENDKTIFYAKVVFFDAKKGYGFALWEIEGVQQKDIFLHFSDIIMEGFKCLYKDQSISFQLGLNKKGEPKGINITVLKN